MNDSTEILRPMTEEIMNAVGEYDHVAIEAEVQTMLDPEASPQIATITPQHAAQIYSKHNALNRDVSITKVHEYKRAMERGEWKMNHQGMAFYADRKLADGQHRCAAIALSGKPQSLIVYVGFDKEAIQTIDLGKARTAGEALKMEGVQDGALKSSVIKLAKEYHHLVGHGTRPKYSQIQLVKSVGDHNDALTNCITKADFLAKTVTDSPMKRADIVLHLFIMTQYGGFRMDDAAEFVGSVLTGVAPYEGAPQMVLSKLLTRAKHGAKAADRLNGVARIATIQKAVKLWAEGQRCSKLVWGKKEGWPLASPKDTEETVAALATVK